VQQLADRVTGSSPEDRIARQRRNRRANLYENGDGLGCGYWQTDSDTQGEITEAIETEIQRRLREQRHPETTLEQLRADVIADLLRRKTSAGSGGVTGVLVITDPTSLTNTPNPPSSPSGPAPTLNGRPITTGAAQRILCAADLHAVILNGEKMPLDVYRLQRLATDAQRAALAAIYPTCPCCDTGFWRCEIHHINFWEHGGDTNTANLIPVCGRLHHLIHDQHWRLTIDPDRTVHLHRPDGSLHSTIPPPHARPDAA
jgi:hypothetical protein